MSVAVDDVQALPVFQDSTNAQHIHDEPSNDKLTSGVLSKGSVAEDNHTDEVPNGSPEIEVEDSSTSVELVEGDLAVAEDVVVELEEDVAVEVVDSQPAGEGVQELEVEHADQDAEIAVEDVEDASVPKDIVELANGHAPNADAIEDEAPATGAFDASEDVDAVVIPSDVIEAAEPAPVVVLEEAPAGEEVAAVEESAAEAIEESVTEAIEEIEAEVAADQADIEVEASAVSAMDAIVEDAVLSAPAEPIVESEDEVVAEEPLEDSQDTFVPEIEIAQEESPLAGDVIEELIVDESVPDVTTEPIEVVVEEAAPSAIAETEVVSRVDAAIEVEYVPAEVHVEEETFAESTPEVDLMGEEVIAVEVPTTEEAIVVEQSTAEEVVAEEEETSVAVEESVEPIPAILVEPEATAVEVVVETDAAVEEPAAKEAAEALVVEDEAGEATTEAIAAEPEVVPGEVTASMEEEVISGDTPQEFAPEDPASISDEVLEAASLSAPAIDAREDSMADAPAPERIVEESSAEQITETAAIEEETTVETEAVAEEVIAEDTIVEAPPAEGILSTTNTEAIEIAEQVTEIPAEEEAAVVPEAPEAVEVEEDVLVEIRKDDEASLIVDETVTEFQDEAPAEGSAGEIEVVEASATQESVIVEEATGEDVTAQEDIADAAHEAEVTAAEKAQETVDEIVESAAAIETAEVLSADIPEAEVALEEPAAISTETDEETNVESVPVAPVQSEDIPAEVEAVETVIAPADEPIVVAEETTDAADAEVEVIEAVVPEAIDKPQIFVEEEVADDLKPTEIAPEVAFAEEDVAVDAVVETNVHEDSAEESVDVAEDAFDAVDVEIGVSETLLVAEELEERSKSPWTPSYSVTTQGPCAVEPEDEIEASDQLAPAVESSEASAQQDAGIEELAIESSVTTTEAVEVGEEEPGAVAEVSITELEEEAVAETDEAVANAEYPTSPSLWVPSYSVSSQGPSPSLSPRVQTGEVSELAPVQLAAESIAVNETISTEETPVAVADDVQEDTAAEETQDVLVAETPVALEPQVQLETNPAVVVTERVAEIVVVDEPTTDAPEPLKTTTWVPSYSVSSQGTSPMPSPKMDATVVPELEAEPVPDLELPEAAEETSVEPSEEPAIPTAVPEVVVSEEVSATSTNEAGVPEVVIDVAPEGKGSIWVPSYSVSSQGASPVNAPVATEDIDVEPIENLSPDVASDVDDASPSVESPVFVKEIVAADVGVQEEIKVSATSEPEPASEASTEVVSDVSLVAVSEPEVERPKSPWIPSYSISRQGSSPNFAAAACEDKGLNSLEPLPPSVSTDESANVLLSETIVDEPTTIPNAENIAAEELSAAVAVVEEEVLSEVAQPSAPPSIVVEDVTVLTEVKDATPTEGRPERPWTPSYSVTVQGPGTPTEKVVEDMEASHGTQAFPSSESKKVATKPSLLRLAPVDENEQIAISVDATSVNQLEATTPATARARLESTTSSRFFPGGWFSSTPPKEVRTSLENAEGEFTKSPKSATSPALEVPANTPVEGVDVRKRKGYGCVIM